MAKAYVMSTEDVAVFRQMVEWFRKQRKHLELEENSMPLHGPNVYVAKIPNVGVPPLVEATGTGGDTPGSAICSIYRLHESGKLVDTGESREVFNISKGWIGRTYIRINRLLSGKYIAEDEDDDETTGTGTGTGTGTDDNCVLSIGGVTLHELPVDTSPLYVLGIDSTGCLVLVPVGNCT